MKRRTFWARAALTVPAVAYGLAVQLRNAWYDRNGAVKRAPLRVISVGNLAVGGTGKTPLVAWLASRLSASGHTPAIVSRGYGGTAGTGPLVVSTGSGPRVNARTCGDEPHVLARSLPGVIVVVGSDRFEGARAAAAAGAGAVILDDGFQHRRLARDLDIVVLDGRAPFDGGSLLPKGRLRESPRALRRAHVVVLTRLREKDPARQAIDAVTAQGFRGTIVRAGHRRTGFRDAAGKECPAPSRAYAFCGIGDPALFYGDLEDAGVIIVSFRAFRDHQPYSAAMWSEMAKEAAAMRVPLVTTDKDFSRLEPVAGASLAGATLIVMRIETVVWDEAALMSAVHRAVSRLGSLAETVVGVAALAMVRVLPRRLLLASGAAAGALVGRIDRRHAAIARQNLLDAYGEDMPEGERERIVRACWRHFGRMALDAVAFPSLSPEKALSILQVEGLDRAREALAKGHGLLVFSAHFGQWEAGISAMRRLAVPLSVIVRPLDNPALDRRMIKLRHQAGVSVIRKRSAMRESLRALAGGGGVIMLIDQDARDAGVFVPFFGRPASTTPALALLALRTNAPILPVATRLDADGTIAVLDVEPEVEIRPTGDRDADVLRVTAACTAIVERWVRSKPEQWLWMHRRWKSQPHDTTAAGA